MKILDTKPVYKSRWLNVFERTVEFNGKKSKWTLCSRQDNPETVETKKPDAVVIVATIGDKLVLTSEYRVAIGGRELGFPAGLIEEGQTPEQAAVREMKEETGLEFTVKQVSPNLYSSAGMTNESVCYVIGTAKGEVSSEYLEPNEDIQVILASKEDLDRIMIERPTPNFSARAWPFLLHFGVFGIHD